MRYLSVLSDYFHQIHFAEIKSSLRMRHIDVNFTGEAGVSLPAELIQRNDGASAAQLRGSARSEI
ncbi:MAG TPA: hypothetical protein VII35_14685 [Steroidobacteraceae bacterium]